VDYFEEPGETECKDDQANEGVSQDLP